LYYVACTGRFTAGHEDRGQASGTESSHADAPADNHDYDFLALHLMITLLAPRAMTRQVVPSIVLSVLIVCFFAVALFQPDPPRPGQGGRRSLAGGGTARPGSASPAAERSSGARTKAAPAQPPNPARGAIHRAARASGVGASGSPATSPGAVAGRPSPPPASYGATTTAATNGESNATDSGRRGSFTVVKAGETLGDVALRVYGTTGEAGFLWRANRDALERRDSPLTVGMLLRTPPRKKEG